MKITKFTISILLLGLACLLLMVVLSRLQEGGSATFSATQPNISGNSASSAFKACQKQLVATAAVGGFATGTILVAFTSTTTWPEAEATLVNAGASTSQTIEDFSVNGIIQGNVLPGQEISTACTLQGSPAVRYAGLNTLFSLAQ